MEAKACALSSALTIIKTLAIPSGSAIHGATEFRLVFNKIPQGVLYLIRRRKSSTRAATIHFHDMEDKRSVRSNDTMYHQGHSEGRTGVSDSHYRFFPLSFFSCHRHNPAQEGPSDGQISARCVGVQIFMQHRMSITSVRDRDSIQRRDEAEVRKRWSRYLCLPPQTPPNLY